MIETILISYKWPITVLLSVTICVFILRNAISTLIGNISSGELKDWLKFKTQQETPRVENKIHEATAEINEPKSSNHYYQLKIKGSILETQKKAIEEDLDKIAPNSKTQTKEREETLTLALAETQLELFFEKIYRLIYNTQLDALDRLNARTTVTKEEAKETFESYTKILPVLKSISFKEWSNFLVNMGLVTEQDNKYSISSVGVEFLAYLTRKGYSRDKDGGI